MGTFSYRRQSDLRARRFPAVGSIGDLAAITSYRIAGNRSTRRGPGGHGAAASDEGRQSRWRSQKSAELSGELESPDLDSGVDSGPASRCQAGARADAGSAELDEKERLSRSFG